MFGSRYYTFPLSWKNLEFLICDSLPRSRPQGSRISMPAYPKAAFLSRSLANQILPTVFWKVTSLAEQLQPEIQE